MESVGIVGGMIKVYDPVFGTDSAIIKSKFSSPFKESNTSTAWQFTPLGSSVFAISHVIVSS